MNGISGATKQTPFWYQSAHCCRSPTPTQLSSPQILVLRKLPAKPASCLPSACCQFQMAAHSQEGLTHEQPERPPPWYRETRESPACPLPGSSSNRNQLPSMGVGLRSTESKAREEKELCRVLRQTTPTCLDGDCRVILWALQERAGPALPD